MNNSINPFTCCVFSLHSRFNLASEKFSELIQLASQFIGEKTVYKCNKNEQNYLDRFFPQWQIMTGANKNCAEKKTTTATTSNVTHTCRVNEATREGIKKRRYTVVLSWVVLFAKMKIANYKIIFFKVCSSLNNAQCVVLSRMIVRIGIPRRLFCFLFLFGCV